MDIIKRGAEAILYLDKYEGRECLVKERIKKSYRVPELDNNIRKDRTKSEAKLLSDARRAGVLTPMIFSIEEFKIFMEYIRGERIKEYLNSKISDDERAKIAEEIGKNVGKLHSAGIVHGDLTTSNMILKDKKIYFIDFGLGESTKRTESIATDLSVLEEAFKSTHFRHLNILWDNFIKGYRQTNEQHAAVLKALDAIRLRGRYVKRNKHED